MKTSEQHIGFPEELATHLGIVSIPKVFMNVVLHNPSATIKMGCCELTERMMEMGGQRITLMSAALPEMGHWMDEQGRIWNNAWLRDVVAIERPSKSVWGENMEDYLAARKHLGARDNETLMDALTSHKDVGAFKDEWEEIKKRCGVATGEDWKSACYILGKFNEDKRKIDELVNSIKAHHNAIETYAAFEKAVAYCAKLTISEAAWKGIVDPAHEMERLRTVDNVSGIGSKQP